MLWLVYSLSLVKFILPFLLQHPVYEPHRDEFLYLAEGQHLSWVYPGSSPLLSVLAFLSNSLGAGLFWIKFWPALFGAMNYVLVGRMILLLGGGRFALLLGFLPFIFGYLLQVHFLLAPDFPGIYFQTLMVYGVVRTIRTRRSGGLYWTGIGFGLGMLSQYSTLLFAAGLVAGLALTQERKLLLNPHFLFAFLLGVLLFLPNAIWQAGHGWPGMYQQEGWRRPILQEGILNLPGLLIWGAGLYFVLGTAAGKPYRFVGWTVLWMLASLVLFPGRSFAVMGVVPVAFGFGAIGLGRATGGGRRPWRYGLAGFVVVVGCLVDTVALPVLPPVQLAAFYAEHPVFRRLGLLRWADGRDHALPQEFADMLGWEEMAMKAAKACESLDSLARTEVLLNGGANYGESGAMDYYGPKYGLPPVMGQGAGYLLWTPAAFYDRDVFIFTTNDRGWVNGADRKKFAFAVVVDSVTHPFAREYGSYILLLKGPNAAVRQEWKRMLLQGVERIAVVPEDDVTRDGRAGVHRRESLAGK
jgi:hypothetical protein